MLKKITFRRYLLTSFYAHFKKHIITIFTIGCREKAGLRSATETKRINHDAHYCKHVIITFL